ncbi:MAG: DUF4111 domain-containing protein, partial [Chloroflexota bacterium]|nr:DUF4111 domain-containing protein [Chloroflexota bacterium]
GRFGLSGGFEANPAVWLTLRNFPVSIRGLAAPGIWNDPTTLRQWTLDNLNSYWLALVTRRHANHRGIGLRRGAAMVSDRAIAWGVPGVTRLHYTITTGDITSKSGACHYALTTFPDRWHPLIMEALAIRNGERKRSGSRIARRRDALSYMQVVIDDANAIAAASASRK